jgi:hypothetical protein
VHEFISNSRIGWFGDGTGMHAYHTFLLLKTNEGCHIVTEEVVKGARRGRIPRETAERNARWTQSLADHPQTAL